MGADVPKKRAVALFGLGALLVAGCSAPVMAPIATGKTPVIIDNDGAFDDIKAILFLLDQPDVQIVAITVSGTGIAHCPEAAENISAMLERIGAPEIPVACGRQTPLAGDNAAPQVWRDAADTLGGVALPDPRPLSDLSAPELLAEAIEHAGDDAVIVALGPLTNLAEAVEADPDLLDGVSMMYLMGGAVDAGGNVLWAGADAEFNIWADPAAAGAVFGTTMPITLVPLDATNQLPVTPYLYEAVAAHREASATSRFLAEYLDVSPLFGGLYHWDELAAVASVDESVVTIEERLLAVVTEGSRQGATVESPDGRPVRVAVDADRSQFESHFYAAMIGTADPGIPPWEPDAVISWDGSACTYEGPDPLPGNLFLRIDNAGESPIAFVTGVYAAGTTTADFEAALEAAEEGVPDWWLPSTQIIAPKGAHDVWPVRGGEGMTGLCYLDPGNVWEMVGPRLPEG